jgi:hypothetical protein
VQVTLRRAIPAGIRARRCDRRRGCRSAGWDYDPKRIPSYTDRILWRDRPGLVDDHSQLWLAAVPQFASSDHKPVVACHSVRVPRGVPAQQSTPVQKQYFEVVVTNLHADRLPAMDNNGLADPYVRFECAELGLGAALPGALLAGQDASELPTTAVCKKTLSPRWENGQVPRVISDRHPSEGRAENK